MGSEMCIRDSNWLVPQEQPDWIANAKSKPFLDNAANSLIEFLPTDIEEFVEKGKEFIPGSSDETDASNSTKPSDEIGREIDSNNSN